MPRRTISLTALLAAALLALGGVAHGASPDQIIDDCAGSQTGFLEGSYSKADLRRALRHVRGDIAEYTGCYDAITQKLSQRTRPTTPSGGGNEGGGDPSVPGGVPESGGGTPGSTPSGGGSDDPEDEVVPGGPPADVQVAPTPQPGSSAPVRVGDTTVRPGSIPDISQAGNELPAPLVVFLVLLGAAALGAAATTIGRRVLARRGA